MDYLEYFKDVPSSVYAPDDDSFLLASAVEAVARGKVLDVGCGSGFQSIAAGLNPKVSSVVGVDLNPQAIEFSKVVASRAGIGDKCKFIEADFFKCVELDGLLFDTIICNPPYLPTSPEEKLEGPYNNAFDGGSDGRSFIGPFLETFPKYMAPGGQLLTLASSLSDTGLTIGELKAKKFSVTVLGEQSFFYEKLSVLQAVK